MSGLCFDTGHTVAALTGVPITRERYSVVEDVLRERHAQTVQWGEQNHPDGTGEPGDRQLADLARKACDHAHRNGIGTWRHILDEELCEALAESDPAKLRTELIQVAAVAVAWVEAIDRRAGQDS